MKNEEEKMSKKKDKGLYGGKFLKKPKIHIQPISAEKIITQGKGHYALAREGRTGYFNDEYKKETKWLEK